MTLYGALVAAGAQIDSHESDLYVEATPEVARILAEFPTECENARTFRSQIDGRLWWDVPFAFQPWWDRRLGRKPCIETS